MRRCSVTALVLLWLSIVLDAYAVALAACALAVGSQVGQVYLALSAARGLRP